MVPCITSNSIRPVPGVEPYTSRLWQFALDDRRTIIARYVVQRVRSAEDRERWAKLFEDVVKPRLSKVSSEDAVIAAAQGDLLRARAQEYLFAPDMDMLQVRRQIKHAYLAQLDNQRVPPSPDALVFPLLP